MWSILRHRWWWIVNGIAAIAFGVLAFMLPGITLLALVFLVGAYALVHGVTALILVYRARERLGMRRIWPVVLTGIAGIVAGVLTFILPGITAIALLAIFAAWSIVRGVFEVIGAVRLRRQIKGEWLLALAGVLSILVGVLLIANPGAGLLAMAWLAGIYSILLGILYIAIGVRLPEIEKRADLAAHAA